MVGLLQALLAAVPAALAFQGDQPRVIVRSRPDIEQREAEPRRRSRHRLRATPADSGRAYRDPRAKDLIGAARAAMEAQDSSLVAYDATVVQRMSAGLKVKSIGRDRLLFRSELAARVRWSRPNQVWIDMLGARTAAPASFPGARVLTGLAELVPVPYFPGSDRLMWWLNVDGNESEDDDDDNPFIFVHPLDDGAESVYEYTSGDSVTMNLPSGRVIRLHEVGVRAREAAWDLINGSLWFESASGQLVRAVFRPAIVLEMKDMIGEDDFRDIPAPVRATVMNPSQFEIEAFTIEYGLHDERWWLPRTQTARGEVRMGFMRSPASIEQTFRYSQVNGADPLPTLAGTRRRFATDLGGDMSIIATGAVDAVIPGKVRANRARPLNCEVGDTLVHRDRRGALRVTTSLPCDTLRLLHAPELPPSIFADGEELFGVREARELMKTLDMAALPIPLPRTAPPARVTYGTARGMMRYNRVEGFSAGVLAERQLGREYEGSALLRLGSADLEPNAELRIAHGALARSVSFGAYRRLEAAGDWGDPMGLGNSVAALLFGRDEGFYYRTLGASLASSPAASRVTWRLLAEQQRTAKTETLWSLARQFGGSAFGPNLDATAATQVAAQARVRAAHGLDPRALRLSADLRAEASAGTFDFTRIAGDITAARSLFSGLGVALTAGAGTSGGTLTPQRSFWIGGTHSVRGQRAGVMSGNSYWLARGELGTSGSAIRPLAFYDAGWAGSRSDWGASAEPRRGAGVGLSILDGLMRIDVARGVNPRTAWRAHLYLEAAF